MDALRFLWNALKGNRLRPWRSEFLKWRFETYTGQKAETVKLRDFLHFGWRERRQLTRFLRWTGEINRPVSRRRG
jgi:hypothetical protein